MTIARFLGSSRPGDGADSATGVALRRLRVALLACAVILLLTTAVLFWETRATTNAVARQSAPSIVELTAAHEALVAADLAVIRSFDSGEVRLAGPGADYQDQIAMATQSLARAAEANSAGPEASQQIQLVQGLVVAYMGLVGQADANYRQAGGAGTGLTYLWYASQLLHAPAGGVLSQLEELRDSNEELLTDRVGTGVRAPAVALSWILPLLALLVALWLTLGFLKRRFRRTVNLALLAAAGLALGLAAAASVSFVADSRLQSIRDDLAQGSYDSQVRTEALAAGSGAVLTDLVRAHCQGDDGSGCDAEALETILRADSRNGAGRDSAGGHDLGQAALTAVPVTERISSATAAADVVLLAPLFGLGIPLLILIGLHPRIDEYRYRAR